RSGIDRSFEFDDVEMPADLAGLCGVNGADRKIAHADPDLRRGGADGGLDLLADQMLAECRERVGEPAGDEQARRVAADEADSVADDVGPKPGAGGQCRGVVDVELDIANPMSRGLVGVDLGDRYEFVKDAVIEVEAQTLAIALIGGRD